MNGIKNDDQHDGPRKHTHKRPEHEPAEVKSYGGNSQHGYPTRLVNLVSHSFTVNQTRFTYQPQKD
jgi:hypothetical protein